MKQSCLFVVDVQNGFIRPATSYIVPRIKELLESSLFEHIIFTRFINTPDSAFVNILNWHKLFSPIEYKIVDEIQPFVKLVFDKTVYTSINKNTINFIKKNNINQVFICGIDTDCCVLKTAVDLFEINIQPYVLEYYCASTGGKKSHDSGIFVLERLIGSDNIIKEKLINN